MEMVWFVSSVCRVPLALRCAILCYTLLRYTLLYILYFTSLYFPVSRVALMEERPGDPVTIVPVEALAHERVAGRYPDCPPSCVHLRVGAQEANEVGLAQVGGDGRCVAAVEGRDHGRPQLGGLEGPHWTVPAGDAARAESRRGIKYKALNIKPVLRAGEG